MFKHLLDKNTIMMWMCMICCISEFIILSQQSDSYNLSQSKGIAVFQETGFRRYIWWLQCPNWHEVVSQIPAQVFHVAVKKTTHLVKFKKSQVSVFLLLCSRNQYVQLWSKDNLLFWLWNASNVLLYFKSQMFFTHFYKHFTKLSK